MAELFVSLPRQIYCCIERRYVSDELARPLEPASWFGLTSIPGRAWGLTVLLECGAVYSQLPPNAVYFGAATDRPPAWPLQNAQLWDCFGYSFAVHAYEHLEERAVIARIHGTEHGGRYLFTAQHYGDGYSRTPEQAKQYHFVALENGRLAALPANHLLFCDPAFTRIEGFPTWLRRQTEVFYAEG